MSQRNCPKCNRHLPPPLRRCFNCGARIYVEKPVAAENAKPAVAESSPVERGELSEIQREILLCSWRQNRGPIYICGTDHVTEGEVKSGEQRFYGNDAVVAIAGLLAPGLIVTVGDGCFTLTDDGARLAVRLASRPDVQELERVALSRSAASSGSALPPR